MMGVKGIREKNVYFYYIILRLTGLFQLLDIKVRFLYNCFHEIYNRKKKYDK
jgi:hypothetical protein